MTAFVEFVRSHDPMWVILIFPLMFGVCGLSTWRDYLKRMKLERYPETMDEDQYRKFNKQRSGK